MSSFISKSIVVHDNKYDYNKVEYINNRKKVVIICPIHGEFLQAPRHHLRGSGCPQCAGNISNLVNFIKNARKVHGDKYDYSSVRYTNSSSKVAISCHHHGIFYQRSNNHLKGQGCPKCRFVSTDDFIKQSISLFGNNYKYHNTICNSKTDKVSVICKEHGEFLTNYNSHIIRKMGCPKCEINRKTNELISKFSLVHGSKYDYSEVQFKGTRQKITIICPYHGRFRQLPRNHLKGNECPKCSLNNKSLTKEEFLSRANSKHGCQYQYGDYNGLSNNITIICPKHGPFGQIANNHIQGSKCPKCCSNSILTFVQFKDRAISVHGDKYDYSEVEYKNYKSHVKIICPKHGPFYQTPKVHLIGHGCQKCSISRFHQEVYRYISSKYSGQIVVNDRSAINPREIDLFISELKFGIECHGEWWHQNNNRRHVEKAMLAHQQNIDLFQIFYNEWLSKREILESMICNKLGLSKKIYAKKCQISNINNDQYRKFMDKNHLQGYAPASYKYGLWQDNKLIAALGIKKHQHYEYEISRYACILHNNIVGGFSRLLSIWMKDKNPNSIITSVDARYYMVNMYCKSKFQLIEHTNPNYFYYKNGVVLSRQQCQKHKLPNFLQNFDNNKNVHQNMINNKYCIVYDAGRYKLLWRT